MAPVEGVASVQEGGSRGSNYLLSSSSHLDGHEFP